MITPMKKLTLLLFHRSKEQFLQSLRDIGVVHVQENSEAMSDNLRSAMDDLREAERTYGGLRRFAAAHKLDIAQERDGDAKEVMAKYEDIMLRREKLEQKITVLQKDIAALEPWGEFSWDRIHQLRDAGIAVRFFTTSTKKFAGMEKGELPLEVVATVGSTVYFMVITREGELNIPADEVTLPRHTLSEALDSLAGDRRQLSELDGEFSELVKKTGILEDYMLRRGAERDFEGARLSFEKGAEGSILALTGFVPIDVEKKLTTFLDENEIWYELSEPLKHDAVPVKLKNPNSAMLFKPILDLYSLPSYFEIDPTAFVAPFFAIFFGLCLGDLGYGILLIIISSIGMVKVKPKMKPFMQLGVILGVCTGLAGLALNSFFGAPIFEMAGSAGFVPGGQAVAMLSPVATETGTYFPAMPFSVYIGLIQLLLGMGLRIYSESRDGNLSDVFSPLASFIIVPGIAVIMAKIDFLDMGKLNLSGFDIGGLIAAVPMAIALILIAVGLLLIVFDNLFVKRISSPFLRPVLIFWDAYNFASGLMSTSLSYLRLFALGLAGGLLGAAFNQIAFMLITNDRGAVNWATPLVVFTILILIIGHSLNLALSALGAFVHPLRLTFVEFYGGFSLGFKGGGKPYKPLSKVTQTEQ